MMSTGDTGPENDDVEALDGAAEASEASDTPVPRIELWEVSASEAGGRLDAVLSRRLTDLSRSRLAQLTDEGAVLVDGQPSKPAYRLRAGQRVRIEVPPPQPALPEPEDLPIHVLYEDSDVIVLDKAAGMVVHPAAGVWSGTLVNALLHHVRDLGDIGGTTRPGIVHRLDKDTSGAIVVAKNAAALTALQQSFQQRTVQKTYIALCHGVPPHTDRWTIDTPFGRHPTDRVRMTSRLRPETPSVRRAVTHVRVEAAWSGTVARLEVDLETGRTHQIRVHLAESGFPLLGDATYGSPRKDREASPIVRSAVAALGRQALHARRLDFPHPRTGKRIVCEAPFPVGWIQAEACLDAALSGRGGA